MQTDTLEIISIKKFSEKKWRSVYRSGDLNQLIYPASISKIFVGAEVLRQVELGFYNLTDKITMTSNNIVDFDPSEFIFDKRPLLKTGDIVTLELLLDLMLGRSDNTATNQLIDLVTRESINENTIFKLGMDNCKVTRKYCPRNLEDDKYKEAPILMCTPAEIDSFFQKLHEEKIHSKFVSQKLSNLMSHETGVGYLQSIQNKYPCVFKGGSLKSKMFDGRFCVWKHYAMTINKNGVFFSIVLFTITKSSANDTLAGEKKIGELFNIYVNQ